jgi:hypothetical protein
MDREELTATSWFRSRVTVAAIIGLGLFFSLWPDALVGVLGDRERVRGMALFLVFALLAWQSWEIAKLRVHMAELMEALHQLLYGKDYRRDREAIDILVDSLEKSGGETAKAAHAHLVRLTGQNFAADPKVWRSWWDANRKTFEKKR